MNRAYITVCLIFLSVHFMPIDVMGVHRGSDLAVSVEPFFSFPAGDPDNQMLAFGYFRNGFGLDSSTTTCTFAPTFPVLGYVNLHGGKLYLNTDLSLENVSTLITPGSIFGNGHLFDIAESITGIPATFNTAIDNTRIFLNSDLTVSGTINFTGNCTVDGRGNKIVFDTNGNIIVGRNSRLHFRNVCLDQVMRNKLRCFDNSGAIVLDDVEFILSGNYTFSRGCFDFVNNVDFIGTYTFFYQSALTSTIEKHAHWTMNDDIRISIGRSSSTTTREPLYFADNTSIWDINGADFSINANGIRITRGTILINKDVLVEVNSTNFTNGLALGNDNAADDPFFIWGPSAIVHLPKGHLLYASVNQNNFQTQGTGAHVDVDPAFNIFLNENLTLPEIQVDFTPLGWGMGALPGKTITYRNSILNLPGNQFIVNGQRYDPTTTLLNGGSIIPLLGSVVFDVLVQGANNSIQGAGSVFGQISLRNASSQLFLGVSDGVFTDIILGGGYLALTEPLLFADDAMITGSGTVNIGQNFMNIGGQSLVSTSTLYFDSNNGYIELRANLNLTSQWTFSGHCTILGQGNAIKFGQFGQLIVERGSTVTFKDLTLGMLEDGQIVCNDNASKIVFNNATWSQDSDTNFQTGSFVVNNQLTMIGRDTSFSYKSLQQSLISPGGTLNLTEGFIFSYRPVSSSRNLVALQGNTSKIIMDSATLSSTSTGWQLTKGVINVHGDCSLESEALSPTEGIVFGDGTNPNNDVTIDIYPDSGLNLLSGYVRYKNLF